MKVEFVASYPLENKASMSAAYQSNADISASLDIKAGCKLQDHTFPLLEITVSSSVLRQMSSALGAFCCLFTHVLLGQYLLQPEPISLHGHRFVAHLVLHPRIKALVMF